MSPKTQVALYKTIGTFLGIVLAIAVIVVLSVLTEGVFFGFLLVLIVAGAIFFGIFTFFYEE